VDQNNDVAAEFYKKAMDAGHLTAPEYLGDYYQGKRDYEEAIKLYGESYSRGNICADYKLIQVSRPANHHKNCGDAAHIR
jgi:TPR repeat protein